MNKSYLNIIIHSEFIDKIHYGLTLGTASKALDHNVIIFFSMKSIYSITINNENLGWNNLKTENGIDAPLFDQSLKDKNIICFEELLKACTELDIKFMVCEMGMKFLNLNYSDLRKDIPYTDGGLVTLLDIPENSNSRLLFI